MALVYGRAPLLPLLLLLLLPDPSRGSCVKNCDQPCFQQEHNATGCVPGGDGWVGELSESWSTCRPEGCELGEEENVNNKCNASTSGPGTVRGPGAYYDDGGREGRCLPCPADQTLRCRNLECAGNATECCAFQGRLHCSGKSHAEWAVTFWVTNGAYVLYLLLLCGVGLRLARHGWNGTIKALLRRGGCVGRVVKIVNWFSNVTSLLAPGDRGAATVRDVIDPNGDLGADAWGAASSDFGIEVAATVFGCWAVMGSAFVPGPGMFNGRGDPFPAAVVAWAGAVYNVPTLLFEGMDERGAHGLFNFWEIMGFFFVYAYLMLILPVLIGLYKPGLAATVQ